MTKVAVVHDDLTQRGGAERVVLSLTRLFPDAPVFTTIYDSEATYPEFRDVDVRTTFLQHGPTGNPRALLPFYPAAIRSIDLSGYDLVVSSSSRFAHGVRVPDGYHLTYCYSPPRYLYQADGYFGPGGPVGHRTGKMLKPVLGMLRRWDQDAARRPDQYVAISSVVAERIERAYGRSAAVVHPPVDVERFTVAASEIPTVSEAPYYLVVSRFLPYKRIDLAVAACTARNTRLVVVGTGPTEAGLRSIAGPSVEFRSRVADDELEGLLAGCTATFQPGLEDFGLTPLEGNASGRPCIAYGGGGALETVRDGETGVLLSDQSVEALVAAMDRVESMTWSEQRLRAHAETFREERFHGELLTLLEARQVA